MTIEAIESACEAQSAPVHVPHPLDVGPLALHETFYPIGCPLEIRTNAPEILEMYSNMWPARTQRYAFAPMLSDVYVAPGGPDECPPAPCTRYQRPIFTNIADGQHHVVVDKDRRRTWTSLTTTVLRHRLYVETFFLMMPLATLPMNGIHAACVAWNNRGVLLCGDSGAGKSTLSYACARAGWDYISDDMSLLVDPPRRIIAGNSHLVRFRPAAAELFPEIRGLELTPRGAGKPSIELSTFPMTHVKRRHEVRVDFIVFLNRRNPGPPQLVPYRKDVARLYMSQGLYGSDQAERDHAQAVDHLLNLDVLELHYSNLDFAIERLRKLVEEGH